MLQEGIIHITQGYMRDHQPDLNQELIQLISKKSCGTALSNCWLVVYNQASHGLAEQTVNKQHLKQSQPRYKAFNASDKQFFSCVRGMPRLCWHT